MKGLLIKDLKLMTRQKTMLFIIAAIIVLFPALEMDAAFIVTYTMVILVFMTVSTVTYDDFDNGMAFLFILPVDRKTYVREKYVLGLSAAIVGWLSAVLINAAYIMILGNGGTVKDMLISAAMVCPVALIMWGILLPMQLKFGAEKARIVIFGVVGVIAAVGVVVAKIAEGSSDMVNKVLEMTSRLTTWQIAMGFFALTLVGLLISYVCSVKIMEKKEY